MKHIPGSSRIISCLAHRTGRRLSRRSRSCGHESPVRPWRCGSSSEEWFQRQRRQAYRGEVQRVSEAYGDEDCERGCKRAV
ncbi:hypothetical protein GT037_002614 [Alternaria burnsii]|uniref:Uncharacterized protein n=1 Tax=Alternaria burnsii TaxID=1187904 RepID=A0A8H7EI48_9PLEO|nr:uncharacterized protein GT037_002614 [Alternaria burnsii]KAF7678866.1 hypothetical protein GT037_002614 [Alternaria burnsii]